MPNQGADLSSQTDSIRDDQIKASKEKQAALRKKEQDDIERLEKEIVAYLHHQEFLRGAKITKIYDAKQLQEDRDNPNRNIGMQVATASSLAGLREDGIYAMETKSPTGVTEYLEIVLKDGKASFHDPAGRFTERKPEDYGKLIDFLRASTGEDTIHVDFPLYERGPNKGKPNVNEAQLRNIIAMAKERGLYVEFGPNLQQYLSNNERYRAQPGALMKKIHGEHTEKAGFISYRRLSPAERKARWDEFYGLMLDCNAHAKEVIEGNENKNIKSREDKRKYKAAKEKITEVRYGKALRKEDFIADDDDKKAKLGPAYDKLKTDEAKMDKLNSYLDNVDKYMPTLEASKKALDNFSKEYSNGIANNDADTDDFQKLAKTIAENKDQRSELISVQEKAFAECKNLINFCSDKLNPTGQSDSVKNYLKARKDLDDFDPANMDQKKVEAMEKILKQAVKDAEAVLSPSEKKQIHAITKLESVEKNLGTFENGFKDVKDAINALPEKVNKKIDDFKAAVKPIK